MDFLEPHKDVLPDSYSNVTQFNSISVRQKRICEEYVKDLNWYQASLRAGTSKHMARSAAYLAKKDPVVMAYTQSLLDERRSRCLLTSDSVLADLQEVKEACMAKKPVVIYNRDTKEHEPVILDGEEVTEMVNAPVAGKMAELMGKHLGMFGSNDVKVAPVTIQFTQNYVNVPDSNLPKSTTIQVTNNNTNTTNTDQIIDVTPTIILDTPSTNNNNILDNEDAPTILDNKETPDGD